MFLESAASIRARMLQHVPAAADRASALDGAPRSHWLFTNEIDSRGNAVFAQDHLCCFVGGLFTLAAIEANAQFGANATHPLANAKRHATVSFAPAPASAAVQQLRQNAAVYAKIGTHGLSRTNFPVFPLSSSEY
jgi:hypothetical protein